MNKILNILMPVLIVVFLAACQSYDGQSEVTLEYKGHSVFYKTQGDASKTLVFLHGWTGSVNNWKFQIDAFPEYRVLVIDLPGNGQSSKVEGYPYSPSFYAEMVMEILAKENIAEAVFIGHSMGLSVIDVIAQTYPEVCSGIVSVDGTYFTLPTSDEEIQGWIEYNRQMAEMVMEESGKQFFLSMLFSENSPEILKEEILLESQMVPLSVGYEMIMGVERDIEYWKERFIDTPFLAIYGPAFQPGEDYQDELSQTFRDPEYHYIPDVSHYLMMEQPYRVNQIIHDFLAKHY